MTTSTLSKSTGLRVARIVLQGAVAFLRWFVRYVLTYLYVLTTLMSVGMGAIMVWSWFTAADNADSKPVAGTLLILIGLAVFVIAPRLLRKVGLPLLELSRGFGSGAAAAGAGGGCAAGGGGCGGG